MALGTVKNQQTFGQAGGPTPVIPECPCRGPSVLALACCCKRTDLTFGLDAIVLPPVGDATERNQWTKSVVYTSWPANEMGHSIQE